MASIVTYASTPFLARAALKAGAPKAVPTAAPAAFGRPSQSIASATSTFSRGAHSISAAVRRAPIAAASHGSFQVTATLSTVRVVIQGRNIEVTDSIRDYMEERIDHAIGHFEDAVREIDAKVSVRGGEKTKGQKAQRAELTIYTKYGIVRAEEEKGDLYAAVDLACDKASRQLRKMKEKAVEKGLTKGNTGGSGPQARGSKIISEILAEEEEEEEEKVVNVPKEVVRAKYYHMPGMTTEEAIDRMRNVDHSFYVFRNEESGEINVLYQRNHGGYGVIIPRQTEEDMWKDMAAPGFY